MDEFELHNNIMDLMGVFKKWFYLKLAKEGVRTNILKIMRYINDISPLKASELSNLTKIQISNLTPIINKLEEEEYVERVTNTDDRRVVKIKLTPKGVKLQEEMMNIEKTKIQNLYRMIPKDKISQLNDGITEIVNFLKEGIKGGEE